MTIATAAAHSPKKPTSAPHVDQRLGQSLLVIDIVQCMTFVYSAAECYGGMHRLLLVQRAEVTTIHLCLQMNACQNCDVHVHTPADEPTEIVRTVTEKIRDTEREAELEAQVKDLKALTNDMKREVAKWQKVSGTPPHPSLPFTLHVKPEHCLSRLLPRHLLLETLYSCRDAQYAEDLKMAAKDNASEPPPPPAKAEIMPRFVDSPDGTPLQKMSKRVTTLDKHVTTDPLRALPTNNMWN